MARSPSMATLIRPPPNDPSKSAMENTLELTRLSDIDPVSYGLLFNSKGSTNPTCPEPLHEHPAVVASSWRPRCIRRSCYRPMPSSRTEDRRTPLHRTLNALLLCPCRERGDTDYLSCGASARWEELRNEDGTSTTEGKGHIHSHTQLPTGSARREEGRAQYTNGRR